MTDPDPPMLVTDAPQDSNGESGPLSDMLIMNAELIDFAIDRYGASAVAEFFVNVGVAMAARYGLAQDSDGKFIPVIEEEVK